MTTRKVRTTFQPDVELEVDENELKDLRNQGLLVETDATTDEGIRKAAEKQVEKNTAIRAGVAVADTDGK